MPGTGVALTYLEGRMAPIPLGMALNSPSDHGENGAERAEWCDFTFFILFVMCKDDFHLEIVQFDAMWEGMKTISNKLERRAIASTVSANFK